jgi:hypothetical protein
VGKAPRRAIASGTGLLVVLVCSAAVGVGPALAAQEQREDLPISFPVKATNGYEVTLFAQNGATGFEPAPDYAALIVKRHGAAVTYVTPKANVTATSVKARFGALGSVDMTLHPSGRTRVQRSPCGAEPVEFDSGPYEGTLEFHGEDGYAEAIATSARPDLGWIQKVTCEEGEDETVGSRRGAELDVVTRGSSLDWPPKGRAHRIDLRVNKNRPSARSRFEATVEENSEGMLIGRGVEVWAKPGAFVFPRDLGRATVRPPAPFSGNAIFVEVPDRSWRGDLSVDFPGRAGVRLVEKNLGVELFPARLLPGLEPF